MVSCAKSGWQIISRLIIDRDVIELQNLETQLRRSQYMESLRRFADGIAHDLNKNFSPRDSTS